MTTKKIGFIGLSRMGLPMSYNLLRAGFDLTVHNRSQGKVQEIAASGAAAARSTSEVAQQCGIVLACLPTSQPPKKFCWARTASRPTQGPARSSWTTAHRWHQPLQGLRRGR
ncbi:MAG: NAD(P)-binding domain-containing protein [Chloroflexi bacterium]|nr:NAD(P)-binding domain-containing protein [Chloroflexota bacterium]